MNELNTIIERAAADLAARSHVPEQVSRPILERLANEAFQRGRDAALLSIMDTAQAAALWGVSRRRAQAHIKRLHERFGIGARFGREWVITAEEAERYRPGPPGRPRGSA